MKRVGCFISIILLFSCFAYGQNDELEKLKHDLALTKDSITIMRLMNKIGFLIHLKSADSSFYYGVKAKRIAEKYHDNRGAADALTNMAIGLTLKGLYNQSLNYYSKAYHVYAQIPDTGEMAQMLMNSAITYSFTSDSNRTKEFARRALFTAQKLKGDSILGTLYTNYVELGGINADSANFYLDKAQQIALRFHDDRSLLFIMQERAQLLLARKNYQSAFEQIHQSLMIAEKHKWDYHEMEALNIYGSYFLAINRPDSALQCYQQIYRMSNASGYVYWKVDVLKSLLLVYQLEHNLGKQAETNKLLVEALEKENDDKNSFLGDYIKYNDDLDKLDKLSIINALNHKKQIWFVLASVVGAITTIALLWVYLKTRRHGRELNKLNEKITIQNQTLKNNDEFKSRLLSMLAHDFRAPLGQTLGMISLLRDDELDKEVQLRSFDSIENDLQEILVTFDNILQWIKKQLAGYVFTPEKLGLYQLIEQSAGMFKQAMEKKEIVFQNMVNTELVINSDREIVQFINRNLIHNAVKYSPQKGTITVKIGEKQNELIVSVGNEGKGMNQEQLGNLFRFKNKESIDRGAGMALTLSYELITLLKGRIWAESEPGKGANFYYSLPM